MKRKIYDGPARGFYSYGNFKRFLEGLEHSEIIYEDFNKFRRKSVLVARVCLDGANPITLKYQLHRGA